LCASAHAPALFAAGRELPHNPRMAPLRKPRKGIVCVLLTAGLLALPPLCAAQAAAERSLAEAARDKVKDVAVSAWHSAQDLSAFALGLIGVDYRYGGTSPETGLDCSGLVRYVFQQVTGVTLPRTAKEMSRVGDQVAQDELKPGDLVFFNTRRFAFSHVGIYLGDNRFIHAPSRGREVEVATLDKSFWQKRFSGARRLVGVVPELVPSMIAEAQGAPLEAPSAADDPQP
jgi:cell wall-associated NlpC family hydrolase